MMTVSRVSIDESIFFFVIHPCLDLCDDTIFLPRSVLNHCDRLLIYIRFTSDV